MNRAEMLTRATERGKVWDFLIIGGGATGVGCAIDAASRGFSVLLLEQSDFGKGTSSRSTKLVHGGVRYLANGDIPLVRESLQERGILFQNAPHLVAKTAFIVPAYTTFDKFFYGFGLKIYNLLAGKYNFGKSRILSKEETINHLPTIKTDNLTGGILYFDGQFDDSRLLINLVSTASECGATVLNYARVFGLNKDNKGFIVGVDFVDEESGQLFQLAAKAVINATGAFCDDLRKMSDANSTKVIAPSQGAHIVLDKSFLRGENALMIPKTSDGRVLFALPWHGKTLVGTTDTPIEKVSLEPQAFAKEIEFILETAGNYLQRKPKREDILSIFVGIRPLVKSENTKNTASLSRDHTILVDDAELLTITGGKWTTYRKMAEDAVNQAIKLKNLASNKCVTKDLHIHGYCKKVECRKDLEIYGSDAERILEIQNENPNFAAKLHENLPYTIAEVIFALRFEMAQTLEDVLARRIRALCLDAKATLEIAPKVAEIMREELGKDENWRENELRNFTKIAENYLIFKN